MLKTLHIFVVLAGIALVSGLVLGSLQKATAQRAADNILRFKKIPALLSIYETMPGGSKLTPEKRAVLEEQLLATKRLVDIGEQEPLTVFLIGQENHANTVALEAFGQGFGGKLGVMVGINSTDGSLAGIGITTMSETPGLGTRVREPTFIRQFVGMSKDATFKVKKDGGDLDAVTGATVSSRAAVDAVSQARELYQTYQAAIKDAVRDGP